VISHFDATQKLLMLTHCGDSACVSGNRTAPVDSLVVNAGQYSSLAFGADGLAIVAYYDAGTTSLALTHCADRICRSTTTTRVAASKASGEYTAIAIGADGLPVVSYYDRTRRTLAVTHCGTAACDAGNVTPARPPSNDVGLYTAIVSAPTACRRSSCHVRCAAQFVRRCAASTNNVSTTVDDPAEAAGLHSAITIGRDGLPVIAHMHEKVGLRVTHCGSATCAAGAVTTLVTAPGDVQGYYPSIAIAADGLPVVSHASPGTDSLHVSACADAACTAARTTRVDTLDVPHGYDSSLGIGADGLPIVAHYLKGAGALRITKCGTANCQ
jgi:predicted regulator of Ras-like GTPase activity (Roadblock/LC7/MglB family)